jgi:hypothetical protein
MSIDTLIIMTQCSRIFSVTYQAVFVKIMRLQCRIGRFRTLLRCDFQYKAQYSEGNFQNQFESLYRQQPILTHMNYLQELNPC